MPNFTVRLFASAREQMGRDLVHLPLESGSTVKHLRAELERAAPELAPLLSRCAVAVNRRYAEEDLPLREGDEIALIPPVAGG